MRGIVVQISLVVCISKVENGDIFLDVCPRLEADNQI